MEHLLGDMKSRPSGLVNAGGNCHGRPVLDNSILCGRYLPVEFIFNIVDKYMLTCVYHLHYSI